MVRWMSCLQALYRFRYEQFSQLLGPMYVVYYSILCLLYFLQNWPKWQPNWSMKYLIWNWKTSSLLTFILIYCFSCLKNKQTENYSIKKMFKFTRSDKNFYGVHAHSLFEVWAQSENYEVTKIWIEQKSNLEWIPSTPNHPSTIAVIQNDTQSTCTEWKRWSDTRCFAFRMQVSLRVCLSLSVWT